MTSSKRRLTPATLELVERPDIERLASLQTRPFISYTAAKRIRERLEEIINSNQSHRPPSMLIAGATNNGKTLIVQRFVDSHPFIDNPNADALEAQVLYIQMPPLPDPRSFFLSILDKLDAPIRRTAALGLLQSQALRLLRVTRVRILIIDEIHNIHSGRYEQQRLFLNLLRYFSNEARISLVCCGIATATRALQSDEQLANRFEHWPLPRWRIDNQTAALLKTIEMTLPLKKPSYLSAPALMNRIIGLSEGTIGEIIRLICIASADAIHSGEEHINQHILDGIRWIAPSERRQAAERALGLN